MKSILRTKSLFLAMYLMSYILSYCAHDFPRVSRFNTALQRSQMPGRDLFSTSSTRLLCQSVDANAIDAANSSMGVDALLGGKKSKPLIPISKLESMKISDLKDMLKRLGGKPGALRKPELVEQLQLLLNERWTQKQEVLQQQQPGRGFGHGQSSTTHLEARNPRKLKTLGPLAQSTAMQTSNKRSSLDFSLPPDLPGEGLDDAKSNINDISVDTSSVTKLSFSSLRAKFPTGAARDERWDTTGTKDLDLTFLGTASCIPSVSRGVSSIAFRYKSDVWLFDCGEASQLQLQKSRIRASKIKKIFLTHSHGDHSFGLPGVLCLMGQSTQDEREKLDYVGESLDPIDIYGPEGTRDLVRAMVQLTYSRVAAPYRIHELKQVPYLHSRYIKWPPSTPNVKTRFDSNYGEREGGRDIYPDKNGHYHLFDEDDLSVMAAPMQHTIPCVGFVVQEKAREGRLKFENVQKLVDKNKNALKTMLGLKDHMKVFSLLKKIQPNETFSFPDGTTLSAEDIVEPERPGRKIVIMGDTCSGEHIAPLAMGADLLVHEATNAWIKDFEELRYSHHSQHERDTKHHGHSTPHMAGKFAKLIGAKKLILTHFSPRYKGDDSEQSMRIMWRIEDMARSTSGLQGANDVVAAWDNMSVSPERPNSDIERSHKNKS